MENMGRILIVDDDPSILKFMKAILEKNHYSIETASTGVEALEKCDDGYYDLALLDIKLPDMDGTELLQKLRGYPMVKIMVTGFPSQENAIEALNSGADSYIVKPIKPLDLLHIIEENLKRCEEALAKNQDDMMGLLGDFIQLVKGEQDWFTIKSIAREFRISEHAVNKMIRFCENMNLLKLKHWKSKGVIKVQ